MKRFVGILIAASLLAGCGSIKPPMSFIRTYDDPGTWKTIECREGVNEDKDTLWQTVVDVLTQKFDLEVIDKDSGYIRTSWKYTYAVEGEIIDRYRARIIVKFMEDSWKNVQIKSEANWLTGNGWALGYDTRLLEDAFGDIQGRIGRVRR